MMGAFSISTIWLLAPLLVAVMLFDLRLMKIPNKLVLLFVVLFICTAPFVMPVMDIAWRIGGAGIVFFSGLAAFAARLMGGGDVKILAALALFIPPQHWMHFGLILSGTLFAGIIGLTLVRFAVGKVPHRWKSLHDRRRYPMGLSIGSAGIALAVLAPSLPAGL